MGTPERTFIYYYYYDSTIYGVLSESGDKVSVVSMETDKHMRVAKGWIKKKIESGEIDISKDREGFSEGN